MELSFFFIGQSVSSEDSSAIKYSIPKTYTKKCKILKIKVVHRDYGIVSLMRSIQIEAMQVHPYSESKNFLLCLQVDMSSVREFNI